MSGATDSWAGAALGPRVLAHNDPFGLGELGNTYLIGIVANAVIAVAFLAVAVMLAINLTKGRQWTGNILGTGTFLLYTTCGGGHLVRLIQLLYPWLGIGLPAGIAVRYEYTDWHPWVFDLMTMAAGVWYWMMRRRFPDLVSGAAVYEDLRERQRKALQVHDNIVQGLVRAKAALDIDEAAETDEAVAETLEASKTIISDLLGDEGIIPGQLRRRPHTPAGHPEVRPGGL